MATTKSSAVAWYRSRNKNLKAETDALAASLYGLDSEDEHQRYLNYRTYKREVMRNFVIYLHLALEDLPRALLFDFLVKRKPSAAAGLAEMRTPRAPASLVMLGSGLLGLAARRRKARKQASSP